MVDTYSPRLRFTKPEIGANNNTWGALLNGMIDLVDTAIAGATSITVTGNVTLTTADGLADQARASALILNGSPTSAFSVTIPAGTKFYIVQNNTGQSATIQYSAGNSYIVISGNTEIVFGDGSNVNGLSAQVSGSVANATNASQLGGIAAALYARLNSSQSFTTGQAVTPVTLTDAAFVAVDCALGNSFRVTLAGNRTLAAPTNALDGQVITIKIRQDAGGSRTLAYDSSFRFANGETPVLSTAASAEDIFSAIYYDSEGAWYGSLQKGFA